MLSATINFGREREITQEIGKGLEDSFKDAKKIDRRIATTLSHNTGYLSRVPIVNRLVTYAKSIKPLDSLESELRTALNSSLVSLVRVGKKTQEERERITQLNDIYDTAVAERWGPQKFIRFIEANTDISYVVNLDGEQIDMKDLFAEVDARSSPERREEKQKEYLDWLKQHINLSDQYLESMHALCFVGCEWVGGMTRSYFDLTQLRGGMEEIQKTLRNLGRGGTASMVTQEALRQYGTAYINGMRTLIQGYRKMSDLRDTGSGEFRASVEQLKEELDRPNNHQGTNQLNQGRYLLNPNRGDLEGTVNKES